MASHIVFIFPWELGIWIYFINCVSAHVEWKIGSVFAVAQAWLISEQIERVCSSVLRILGVGFHWRYWGGSNPEGT